MAGWGQGDGRRVGRMMEGGGKRRWSLVAARSPFESLRTNGGLRQAQDRREMGRVGGSCGWLDGRDFRFLGFARNDRCVDG